MRPPQPPNAHSDSLKTITDFRQEVEKRAKAKAKRDAKEANAKQVEAENVALTKQDVLKKKWLAFASKASKSRMSVSPPASRRKFVSKRIKKVASDSSNESSSEGIGDEISMYDQKTILDKAAQSPSPVKVWPSPRRSPRHAPPPEILRVLLC